MDWEQGCEEVLKLFGSVTNSTWLPMYDFDFWILPYLEGKGLTLDQIKTFVKACGDLLSMEIGVARGTPVTDRAKAENNLRQICGEIQHGAFARAAAC
jgi:p-methyltransferase